MRYWLALGMVSMMTAVCAQTGPGGAGNGASNVLWLRADNNVYSDAGTTLATNGQDVQQWNDKSGNSKNATSSIMAQRPNYVTGVVNGLPVLRFTAANNDRMLSTGLATGNAATVWVVGALSSLPTSTPGLIQASPAGGAFGATKTIGIWVDGSNSNVFGRGTQSDLTARDISETTALSAGTFYSISNYYDGSSTITQFVNSTGAGSVSYDGTLAGWSDFGIGREGTESWNGDIAEVIAFNKVVSLSEGILVDNYLAAKYGFTIPFDVYTMDNPGNGDYDYDVAGIYRVSAADLVDDARGSGILRVLNPSDFQNGEYFIWGHDPGALLASNTTDIPPGMASRFARVWRVSQGGNVGNVDLQFDLTGLPDFAGLSTCDAALSLRLLVDANNDGLFADQTPIGGATNVGGNLYRFANVSAILNGNRFTIGLVNSSADGPGGVGGTNGTTFLKLWMKAGSGVSTIGSAVTLWSDQSGNSITTVPPTSSNRPALTNNALNGQPVITFDGVDDYVEMSSNLATTAPSIFIVANKASFAAGYRTMLTTTNIIATAQTAGTDQWGMYFNADVLSTSTLGTTYQIMHSDIRSFNDVDFYSNGTGLTNATNGTAYTGKSIGTIGSNNNNVSGSGSQNFNGNIAEIIVYNSNVNITQRVLIANALAAKYALSAGPVDYYDGDNPGNGNFDFDVAGLGRISASDNNLDAKGNIVRISNATGLGNNEGFIWGHDNGSLTSINTTDLPAGIQGRISRVWRDNQIGNVGNMDIQFDMSGLGSVTASDLRLLVDVDDDGIFGEGNTVIVAGATSLSCNNFVFYGVSAFTPYTNLPTRFTLGTINLAQTPLPVELVYFQGACVEGKATLRWETSSEHNNDHFIVERSSDGEMFTQVGTIPGNGTSNKTHTYVLSDFPPAGDHYYRLQEVDFDGKTNYLKTIRLENDHSEVALQVSPNPVSRGNWITVKIVNLEKDEVQLVNVALYDLFGRNIAVTVNITGNDQFAIQMPTYIPTGVYLVGISAGNQKLYKKVYVK